ncbi:hypothetical protein QBC46DRAFT_124272 [Diplogelasinospora grovesii]|uniref:Uncharacterized protein n=1 Tax=Diplogelasinospora grovesii TaxID=303347 RepID=A0AAN6N958_9PEZI|nr:hypothetical protein QBC46DRAFT_124272 [Diplogelasinospora grovesii]
MKAGKLFFLFLVRIAFLIVPCYILLWYCYLLPAPPLWFIVLQNLTCYCVSLVCVLLVYIRTLDLEQQ